MAEGRSVVQRVQELKEQLSYAEPAEIIKTLKVLQGLDISLDILVETGIGKTVNSFRKHATAGNTAKTLVKQWKKLISSENQSAHRGRKQNTGKDEAKSSVSEEKSKKSRASVLVSRSSNSAPISKKLNKQHTWSEKIHRSRESQKECDHKECSSSGSAKQHTYSEKTDQSRDFESLEECSSHSNSSNHAFQGIDAQAEKSDLKEQDNKKVSEKRCCSVVKDLSLLKGKPCEDAFKQRNSKHVKKPKQIRVIKRKAELSSDEEFEPPTMSFESYLNYDQATAKRKRKTCSTGQQPKKCSKQKSSSLLRKTSAFSHANEGKKDVKTSEGDQSETPNKKAKVASLQDLLNTPLPKFLTGISTSSPPYAADVEKPVEEAPVEVNEVVQFTGQRLNSKMQVYSGPKTVHLSKMLTLYEQCIRVLQNNIELLHEVGGVPFEILEPVLTRCTPKQLFRIEECNPAFTEESDHLWKKHCQRDFKNESLLECESWREMYSRLFNQREEKLKTLTKNIISAQSEKPKGRQVKMAYVTSAARQPKNIRRQREMHGTAGPGTQLQPRERSKTRIPESRDLNNTLSTLISASNCGSSSSSMMTRDEKKPMKKIGPIMKKTLKALKSKAGRR
ncbi:elongin-A-like [Pogoniulus pusillus]|uniref:elongin-A-like n=1 Tax=Pogoniulus pusillus TaxID=488313 RepID=UPI0030B97C70